MRYILDNGSPSLTIHSVDEKFNRSEIKMVKGEGNLTKAQYEAIREHKVVLAHVADGLLRFPDDKKMEALASESSAARRAASAQQQERRENGASSEDVQALAELVAQQAEANAALSKELADLKAKLGEK